jgi:hypothetical protein
MSVTKHIVKQGLSHTEKVVWLPAKVVSSLGLVSLVLQPFSLSEGTEKDRLPHVDIWLAVTYFQF